MKIHFISDRLIINSGYGNVTKHLAQGLTSLGYEVDMTALRGADVVEWSHGILQMPADVVYTNEMTQITLNIQKSKPDVVVCIFQSDDQSLNYIPKIALSNTFKGKNSNASKDIKVIWFTTIEGERVPDYSLYDMADIVRCGGKIVVPTEFAYREILKDGARLGMAELNKDNVSVISYGVNLDIFKPNNLDRKKYCYYQTEVGMALGNPLLLHSHGCYDFENLSCNSGCQYFTEEKVMVLGFTDRDGYGWKQREIGISKLRDDPLFKGKFVYLGIGQNFQVRKRWERLLKAYSILLEDGGRQMKDRVVLHLHTLPVVDPGKGFNLLEEVEILGIKENVSFSYGEGRSSLWSEEGLSSLINIANCYVSSSSGEGFNLGCIESMACGKPSIATKYTSFPELIGEGNGRRGLLAELDTTQMIQSTSYKALVSEKDFASKMKTIYVNDGLREQLSKNCLEFVKDRTWESIIKQWDNLLINYIN